MISDFKPDELTGTVFGTLLEHLSNQPRILRLSRVNKLAADQFKAYYASKSYPVILKGLIPSRLTCRKKVLPLLRIALGGTVNTVRYGSYADPMNYMANRLTEALSVNAFLDMFENTMGDFHYLANIELPPDAIRKLGINCPPYYPQSAFRPPRLWLGPEGAITPLHKDGSDNFAVHLFGSKRWILFPIRDYPFLYMNQPDPLSLPGFACSRVDVRKPNYDICPLFRFARAISVTVHAGETLYLPAGWAHYVEIKSRALMINYWVDNRRQRPAVLHGNSRQSNAASRQTQNPQPRTGDQKTFKS